MRKHWIIGKYLIMLIASIGIAVFSIIATIFHGWIAQTTNHQAMAARSRSLANLLSLVSLAAIAAVVVCIARLIQLGRSRKPPV
jgi:hypothetical protein